MGALVIQTTTLGGLNPTFVPAANGDTMSNDGDTVLRVKNSSGASINVTSVATIPCSHGVLHDEVTAVAAGATIDIGPFRRDRFGSVVTFNYSATASVTVAAVQSSATR